MSKLAEIHNEIGQLPKDFPKLYLLGSTGAGKTSIVQNILGTKEYKFPSVSQMRTTVAVTEYIIDTTLPYKTTLLFKEKKEILDSIEEIVKSAIRTFLKKGSADVINKLKESSDQRFRLKYILDDSFLSIIKNIIIENEVLFQKISEDIKILIKNTYEFQVLEMGMGDISKRCDDLENSKQWGFRLIVGAVIMSVISFFLDFKIH